MRNLLITTALIATMSSGGAALAQSTNGSDEGQKCQTHVDTDKGDGGMRVYSCDDGEGGIGFGGPIKDVDLDHPVGKGKAFLPQAGRDAQQVVQDAGHNIEETAHNVVHATEKAGRWVGKRLGNWR